MMSEVIDSRPFKYNDKPYTLLLMPDEDVSTKDADCYSSEDVKRFNAGDWRFVILVVCDEAGRREYLGACHYGAGDGWSMSIEDFLTDDYFAPSMASQLEATNA